MSSVLELRHRLLMEYLERLADRLQCEEPVAPEECKEPLVRLLTDVVMVLRQHRVNNKGQCNYCRRARWPWRFWRSRPQCAVYRCLDFALRQPLDLLWRQLLKADRVLNKTGLGEQLLPDDRRFHSLNRLFFKSCSYRSIVTPSTPAEPLLALTLRSPPTPPA